MEVHPPDCCRRSGRTGFRGIAIRRNRGSDRWARQRVYCQRRRLHRHQLPCDCRWRGCLPCTLPGRRKADRPRGSVPSGARPSPVEGRGHRTHTVSFEFIGVHRRRRGRGPRCPSSGWPICRNGPVAKGFYMPPRRAWAWRRWPWLLFYDLCMVGLLLCRGQPVASNSWLAVRGS